jgi:hypothetical protein
MELHAHTGIRDKRIHCKYGLDCTDNTVPHRRTYSHTSVFSCYPCECRGINAKIDFFANSRFIRSKLTQFKAAPAIIEFVKNLRPAHRCAADIFKSILDHGNLISAVHMKRLANPDELLKEAVGHPEFRGLIHSANVPDKAAREELDKLIQAYVKVVIDAEYKAAEISSQQPNPASNPAIGALKIRMDAALRSLHKYFKGNDLKRLEAFAMRFVQAGIKLSKAPKGIHFDVDQVCAGCLQLCLVFIVSLSFS